jgi:hypothetical protein
VRIAVARAADDQAIALGARSTTRALQARREGVSARPDIPSWLLDTAADLSGDRGGQG